MNKFSAAEITLMLIAFLLAVILYVQLKAFAMEAEAFQVIGSSISTMLREFSNLRTQ